MLMQIRSLIGRLCGGLALLAITAGCSEAQSDQGAGGKQKGGGKGNSQDRRKDKDAAGQVPGLRRVGSLKGAVPESSGLCPAPRAGSFYTFGDGGNGSTLYQIDGAGQPLGKLELGVDNIDWESLTRDEQGTYYLGDCGNNESQRRDLRLYRFRPEQPNQLQTISFTYPDQAEFPPKKKQRNFDCEAIVARAGQVYLFTKDQGQERESKVYAVPTTAGEHEAKLLARLAIAGQVTDAALRSDGRRLVLLGRGELFVLDGNSWAELLKATPRQIPLTGAGQTEGCAFKDDNTLLISTEQGALYEYTLP
jgi:hypothetical protein